MEHAGRKVLFHADAVPVMLHQKWKELKSGLYVPAFLKRLHENEFGGWQPCPECCTCKECSDGGPASFQVVVSGVVDSGCSNCDENFNGPFVVTRAGAAALFGSSDPCWWAYEFDPAPCNPESGGNAYALQFIAGVMYLNLYTHDKFWYTRWRKTYATRPACKDFVDEDLPFHSNSGGICNGSASTAEITAL
jgi:hypothetical protein